MTLHNLIHNIPSVFKSSTCFLNGRHVMFLNVHVFKMSFKYLWQHRLVASTLQYINHLTIPDNSSFKKVQKKGKSNVATYKTYWELEFIKPTKY